MRIIRNNIFETNSSSTHSLTMCTKKDYEDWQNGKIYYIRDTGKLITDPAELDRYIREQIIHNKASYKGATENHESIYEYKGEEYIGKDKLLSEYNLADVTQEEITEYMENNDGDTWDHPLTYDEYYDDVVEGGGYEAYKSSFTTASGEEVIAFGYYGNDY